MRGKLRGDVVNSSKSGDIQVSIQSIIYTLSVGLCCNITFPDEQSAHRPEYTFWLTECSKNFKPSMTCAQLLKCQTPAALILRTPLSRMVRFCWGMLGLVSNPTHIGHFGKYHNTLCLSPANFALFLFSLGTIVIPKRNWKQCLCKIWGGGGQIKSIIVFPEVAY